MQTVAIPLGRGSEHGFCPSCVLEAVEERHKPPIWCRAWMDATSTWCYQHGMPLASFHSVFRLAQRTCAAVQDALATLAGRSRDGTAAWLQPLARDAAGLALALQTPPLPRNESSPPGTPSSAQDTARLHALVNHVLVRLVSVVEDYDEALFLADHLEAPSPESLTQPQLPKRLQILRMPALGQIRALSQRIWLLGAAARIIGPFNAQSSFLRESTDSRETLRSWLWTRLDAWNLVHLVISVREATAAKLMVPWPAAQAWKTPTTGAQWFRRMETSY